MYSTMTRSNAGFAVPYSVALGPMTLNTMLTPPALPRRRRHTSHRFLVKGVYRRVALPPASSMERLISSMPPLFPPERKTSAPSAANSLAATAPTEPLAPKTRARFPGDNCKLFVASPLLALVVCELKKQIRLIGNGGSFSNDCGKAYPARQPSRCPS
jgi:hypothetical protein